MGIKGAHRQTYSIEAVTSSELEQLVKAIWTKRVKAEKKQYDLSYKDMDASWLYRKFL
jgi:hypothetical protein